MAQDQNIIPVLFQNGSEGDAVSTGNNAAWHCFCQAKQLLIGRTGLFNRITEGYVIECNVCHSRYFVVPATHDLDAAVKVIQI